MFGLTDGEVQARRRYVGRVKNEIEVSRFPFATRLMRLVVGLTCCTQGQNMRAEVAGVSPPPHSYVHGGERAGAAPASPQPERERDNGDHEGEWAREEQQVRLSLPLYTGLRIY